MGAETVICTFRVRPGSLDPFRELLAGHWPTLRRLGLVTEQPEQRFLGGRDDGDAPVIVSIFEWVSAEAVARAHEHPDVAEIWEAMEPLCEARDGRPSMEFPHFEPLPVDT
ncbi:MAG: hypothetical protein AAFZ07_17380 [Actinomycetota bacterium]